MPGRTAANLPYAAPVAWYTAYTGHLAGGAGEDDAIDLALPDPPAGHKWVATHVFAYQQTSSDLNLYFKDGDDVVLNALLGGSGSLVEHAGLGLWSGSAGNPISIATNADTRGSIRLMLTGFLVPA